MRSVALAIAALTLVAGLASVAGAQANILEPRSNRQPRQSEPLPDSEPLPEPDPYEQVEDPDADVDVPKTSCHDKTIRRVVVVGARRVDPDDVRATMRLKKGDTCTDSAVARDARGLWNMGYFDDLVIESDPLGSGIKLTVRVVERPAIRKISYEGNDELDDDEIDEAITVKSGQILEVPEVEQSATKVGDLYSESGFFLAEVSYELRRVTGQANQVDVVFKIDEGGEVEVRRVSFVGNEELPAEELLKIMQTNETGMFSFLSDRNKFNQEAFDEDVTRVQAWYYDKGYLMMRPGRPSVEMTPDRKFVDITIPVEEGPRFRIRDVLVMEMDGAGNEVETIAPKNLLRKDVKLESGDWFSRSEIAQGIEAISRTYRDQGYALVEMLPATDLDEVNHLVDVTINIQRGPLVYIERINVQGNTKTRDAVIRREFRLSEGDLYSQSKIEDGRALTNQLGYFERVDISQEQGSADDQIVLNVEVTEKPTGTFQVGAGFSSLESFIVTAQVQQQNLFGRGQSLGLNLQLSGIRQQIDLNFVEPWFLGSEWSLGFGFFKRIRDFADFRQDSTGANLTTGHPLFNPRLRLFIRYEFENVVISQPRGNLVGGLGGDLQNTFSNIFIANAFRDGITSSLRFTVNWDSRDNRLATTGGIFANYAVQIADQYLGSDNTFVRQTAFSRFYKRVFGPVVFKVNTEMGLITSRQIVPVFERFYLGGIFTIRGYRLQSVGPQAGVASAGDPNLPIAFDGRPIGGDFQAFYNIELEFPIVEQVGIKGVIFSDGGNAWNLFAFRDQFGNCQAPIAPEADRSSQPCGINGFLRYSVGFGIRWFSPLGPLRFEWGIPIRRRPQDAPIRFEFTIGQSF